jgi:lysophospholipase L1-like esterase
MKLQSGCTLLMIGDSITDTGRARPIGQGDGLGNGYVSLVNALLGSAYPQVPVQVINMGIGGNTVRDLRGRWQTDVLAQKPNWLSIMIGINDVWRQFDSPNEPERGVLPEEFETTLNDLVALTKPTVQGLVLMTPFFIEPAKSDPMRARMDQYRGMVKKLALLHDTLFVDTQAAFDAYLEHRPSNTLAQDRVHPNLTGHMILARAFLAGIDFTW